MRPFLIFTAVLMLSACASFGPQKACRTNLQTPAYFTQGEKLAAFRISGAAYGRRMDGLLQLKKTGETSYEATLFALPGGIKLMQAVVSAEETTFPFIVKQADSIAVRSKAERLLQLLVFSPRGPVSCREKDGSLRRYYKEEGIYYEYAAGQTVPEAVILPKGLGGEARLVYAEYAPYEAGDLPHDLIYQDGALEAELILLTLKK